MKTQLEFFFDVGSPYTYLTTTVIGERASALGVEVQWRPLPLGGLFKLLGGGGPAFVHPLKMQFQARDLARVAEHLGVPFGLSRYFPANTLQVQRLLTAADDLSRPTLTRRFMHAYWVEDRDVGDPAVIADVLGDDGPSLLHLASSPSVKDALKANTEEAFVRGAFGAPSFFLGDELYWGNDRLDFALQAAAAQLLKQE